MRNWKLISLVIFSALPMLALVLLGLVCDAHATPLLPGEQRAYSIVEFVDVLDDCKVFRVGAKNETLCDLEPAFKRLETELKTALPIGWLGYGPRTGGFVTIPPGRWFVGQTVRFCRQMKIVGAGGNYPGPATIVYAYKGSGAFHFAHYAECHADGAGDGSMGSVFSDISVQQATGLPVNDIDDIGILVEADSVVERVWTYGFVQGFRVSADVNRTPITGANRWRLQYVTAIAAEHAGISVDGGDANAGLGDQVNTKTNCVQGSRWTALLGPCANIVDSSFLGNTWVATHASGSVDAGTGENFPNYYFDGASNTSGLFGAYSESDAVRSPMPVGAMWLAGTGYRQATGGYRQAGKRSSGLEAINDRNPLNIVTTRMGDAAAPDTGLEVTTSVAGTREIRLKFDPVTLSHTLGVANTGSGIGLRMSAIDPFGAVTLPKGVLLPQNLMISVSTGTPAASLCVPGAVYFEKAPKDGKPGAYQCVGLPSPHWRAF